MEVVRGDVQGSRLEDYCAPLRRSPKAQLFWSYQCNEESSFPCEAWEAKRARREAKSPEQKRLAPKSPSYLAIPARHLSASQPFEYFFIFFFRPIIVIFLVGTCWPQLWPDYCGYRLVSGKGWSVLPYWLGLVILAIFFSAVIIQAGRLCSCSNRSKSPKAYYLEKDANVLECDGCKLISGKRYVWKLRCEIKWKIWPLLSACVNNSHKFGKGTNGSLW